MSQNELTSVKTIEFYNKTQFEAWSEFFSWYSTNRDIVILSVADDATDSDYQVTVFFEDL